MAVQVLKMNYSGSVDFNSGAVQMPGQGAARSESRKSEPGRFDALKLAFAGIPMAVLSMAAVPALAAPFTLTDGNTVITVDPSSGVTGWAINGVSEVHTQEFYYRLGSTGGQSLLSTGSSTAVVQALPDLATVTYTNASAGYIAAVKYQLTAGTGTSASILSENISFQNQTAGSEALHLFKYADYDLNGQTTGQTVAITGTPPDTADQSNGDVTVTSDTVGQGAGGPPNEVQASSGPGLLSAISSPTTPETLNNNLIAGPAGDVNFAFEWDPTLSANGSGGGADTFQVGVPTTITTTFVPEPASLGLFATVGSLFLARRRRRA